MMHFSKSGTAAELRIDRATVGTCAEVRVAGTIGNRDSKGLLAHELTHVVQDRTGQQTRLRLSGVALASRMPLTGRVLQVAMTDATGRSFAVQGRVLHAEPVPASPQEWSIVYETIQRAL